MDLATLTRDRDRLAVCVGRTVLLMRQIQIDAVESAAVLELSMRAEQLAEYCVEQLEDSELRRSMVAGMREPA